MKDVIILASLMLFFLYELIVLIKTQGFIRITSKSSVELNERDKANKWAIGIVNIYYTIFTVAGMAFGTQWMMYAWLFLVGVVSVLVMHYINVPKDIVKKIDSVVSIVLLAMIFMNHYH